MTAEETQIRRALARIQHDNPLIELRPVFPDGRWWTGLFDDHEKLAAAILRLNSIKAVAVYWTFNKVSTRKTITNRLAPATRNSCITNAEVARIRWLFLDYDGSREATRALAREVEAHLSAKGWEPPEFIASGGGFYHFYPVDIPASQAHVIKQLVRQLKNRFDTPAATIDAKCVNAARIARVPGSYHRKDIPTMAKFVGT